MNTKQIVVEFENNGSIKIGEVLGYYKQQSTNIKFISAKFLHIENLSEPSNLFKLETTENVIIENPLTVGFNSNIAVITIHPDDDIKMRNRTINIIQAILQSLPIDKVRFNSVLEAAKMIKYKLGRRYISDLIQFATSICDCENFIDVPYMDYITLVFKSGEFGLIDGKHPLYCTKCLRGLHVSFINNKFAPIVIAKNDNIVVTKFDNKEELELTNGIIMDDIALEAQYASLPYGGIVHIAFLDF